jgi:predicted ester cyclase
MREGLRPFRNCSRKIQFITAGPVHGYKDFEKFHADFLTVFPDLRVEQGDVITEGDKLAARFTVTGTQTARFGINRPRARK